MMITINTVECYYSVICHMMAAVVVIITKSHAIKHNPRHGPFLFVYLVLRKYANGGCTRNVSSRETRISRRDPPPSPSSNHYLYF